MFFFRTVSKENEQKLNILSIWTFFLFIYWHSAAFTYVIFYCILFIATSEWIYLYFSFAYIFYKNVYSINLKEEKNICLTGLVGHHQFFYKIFVLPFCNAFAIWLNRDDPFSWLTNFARMKWIWFRVQCEWWNWRSHDRVDKAEKVLVGKWFRKYCNIT